MRDAVARLVAGGPALGALLLDVFIGEVDQLEEVVVEGAELESVENGGAEHVRVNRFVLRLLQVKRASARAASCTPKRSAADSRTGTVTSHEGALVHHADSELEQSALADGAPGGEWGSAVANAAASAGFHTSPRRPRVVRRSPR